MRSRSSYSTTWLLPFLALVPLGCSGGAGAADTPAGTTAASREPRSLASRLSIRVLLCGLLAVSSLTAWFEPPDVAPAVAAVDSPSRPAMFVVAHQDDDFLFPGRKLYETLGHGPMVVIF